MADRFPIDPLYRYLCIQSPTILADRLNVSQRTILRWQKLGLTRWQADKAAAALDMHGCLLWEDWE